MKLATDTPAPRPTIALEPGGGWENNNSVVQADLRREVYAETYALIQQLSRAQISGVLEVTLRTRTGSLTLPVSGKLGFSIAEELYEDLGRKMNRLEKDILVDARTSQEEEQADQDGTSDRAQVFAFCLPMRPLSDTEFQALPPEARRAYDEHRAERAQAA